MAALPPSGATQASAEPRSICPRCRRPISTCFCAGIEPIATQTRVLILQHPRERDVGIGTARLARLGLANAVLRCDVDFSKDPVVLAAIASGNAHILFPGSNAVDVETVHFSEPITLVVLDGTWYQAQKLLKSNPHLAALPRLRLTPRAPSLYGEIRREPADHCVATIEAIGHVLGYLEHDQERFARFLEPFAAMVEKQRYFANVVASGRQKKSNQMRKRRDPVPALLRERSGDLVCVHGEANAWPRLHPDRTAPEIVHWLARRLATGETFSAVIRPRGRLAPSTCRHLRMDEAALASGETWDEFSRRFSSFLRPSDVLVSWGHFSLATLLADGFQTTHERLDVRAATGRLLRQRTGTVENCVTKMGLATPDRWAPGRAGERIADLCAVVAKLCAWPA